MATNSARLSGFDRGLSVAHLLVGFVMALGLLLTTGVFASPAGAEISQDGRRTAWTAADGSFVTVVGNGFSARPNQCVIYSTLTYDSDAPRMIQSGLVRCNGIQLTGSCPDGQTFVERYNGTSYFCRPGYGFNNGTAYDATTYRQSSTSLTFTGHVSGTTWEQAGFGLTNNVRGYAWGEATGTAANCPAPSKGTFNQWKKYSTSAGWSYVTGSSVHQWDDGWANAPCWATVSAAASDGGFNVD